MKSTDSGELKVIPKKIGIVNIASFNPAKRTYLLLGHSQPSMIAMDIALLGG